LKKNFERIFVKNFALQNLNFSAFSHQNLPSRFILTTRLVCVSERILRVTRINGHFIFMVRSRFSIPIIFQH
jgi:hypothetical protein